MVHFYSCLSWYFVMFLMFSLMKIVAHYFSSSECILLKKYTTELVKHKLLVHGVQQFLIQKTPEITKNTSSTQ